MNTLKCTKLKFVNAAMTEAEKSTMSARIGCVAVLRGRVIASAYNNDGFVKVAGSRYRCHAETFVIARLLRQYAQGRSKVANARTGYIVRCTRQRGRRSRHQ